MLMLSSEGERHDTHSYALPPLSHRPGHEGWQDQSAHLKHDPGSDTDLLIDLEPAHPLGLFAYASLVRYITNLVGAPADVVNRQTVKPLLRETIGREAMEVF